MFWWPFFAVRKVVEMVAVEGWMVAVEIANIMANSGRLKTISIA